VTIEHWLLLAVFSIGAGSLIGFFRTKTQGFGRFTTSVLLIITVVTIASMLYVAGKLKTNVMANVLFAAFGFAGGLFTSKEGN
jgi:hypothetical protein